MKTLLSLLAASLLATSANAATLIVGNKEANTVSFIDLASGEEVAEVATGPMPHEVAVSPDGTRAMVVAYGGNTLDLFDVAKAKKIGTCSLGTNLRPHGIVWTSVNVILATTEGSKTLTMITSDCENAAAISTDQEGSHMLAFDEQRARAYVSNLQDKSVTVIDLAKGEKVADFDAAEEPEGIDLTPDGKELWVANRASNTVYVLDPDSGARLAGIDVGQMPIRLAISPDGKWAVTSDLVDGGVSVIDVGTRKKVRTIAIGGNADTRQVTLVWSNDGKRLFAAETANARIAEVDFETGKVVRYLPAGAGSDGIGWSPVSLSVSR